MNKFISSYLFIFVYISSFYQSTLADEVKITGDIKTLVNIESNYNINVISKYSPLSSYHFKYIYHIPDLNYHYEHFTQLSNVELKKTFEKIGSYDFNIQIYFYPFFNTFYGWKIAETTVTLEICDNFDKFVTIDLSQKDVNLTTDYVFAANKSIQFKPIVDDQSILAHNQESLSFEWLIEGPEMNQTKFKEKTFEFTFESSNDYTITLNILSVVFEKFNGTVTSKIQIQNPVTDITISGNNFVENGSLLDLNITCNGSANFVICHYFSHEKSNNSCFDSGKVLRDCHEQIRHYFPRNGTLFVNIGIKNDVSIVYRNVKITVYKIDPKPSFAFVLIPLISLLLIILIAVYSIIHFIRQRRLMNATIEVATIDNFSIYNNNDLPAANDGNSESYNDRQGLLGEKTFMNRVRESIAERFCMK